MPRIVYVTRVQAAAARLRLKRHEDGLSVIEDARRLDALRAIADAESRRDAPAP